jgi:hypothetical protein
VFMPVHRLQPPDGNLVSSPKCYAVSMTIHVADFQQLPLVKGKTFESTTVMLDGTAYENCNFKTCRVIYKGGPTRISSCYFSPGCSLEMQDNAAYMLQTLGEIGFVIQAPAWLEPPQIRR